MTARGAAAEHRPQGGRVLVVESDPQIGRAIVEQLTADAYQAELARTAEHARIRAAGGAPSVVVLGDLGSPRGALELLEEMRDPDVAGSPWAAETPVMVIGPCALEPDVLRAFDAGADDYLARPARYLELRARCGPSFAVREEAEAGPGSELEPSRSTYGHTRRAFRVTPWTCAGRSSTCSCTLRASRNASSGRTSCCERCGGTARAAPLARSTAMPAGCVASSTWTALAAG
jgi:DNA-binding response OmpR family regulator